MIYSSADVSFLIIYIFLMPAYITLAGLGFTYYALKSNKSAQAIEAFKNNLGFPGNIAFMGNPPLIFWLIGRGVATWNVERAETLRRWMLISFGLCHLPLIIRLLVVENVGDKLTMLVLIILSGATVFVCARFGHRLLEP
jgi:hypothetical protein